MTRFLGWVLLFHLPSVTQRVTWLQQLRVVKEGGAPCPSVLPRLSVPPKDGASSPEGPQAPLSGHSPASQLLDVEKGTPLPVASAPEVPSSLGEGVLLVLQRSLLGFLLRGRSHAAPSGSARIEPHRPPWSSPQGRRSPDPIPPAATVSCQARLLQSQRVGTRPSTWLQYARHRGRRRPVRKLPTCLAAPEDPLPGDWEVPPVASGASAAFQPSPGRCVSTV